MVKLLRSKIQFAFKISTYTGIWLLFSLLLKYHITNFYVILLSFSQFLFNKFAILLTN